MRIVTNLLMDHRRIMEVTMPQDKRQMQARLCTPSKYQPPPEREHKNEILSVDLWKILL
jgi:hypothetical protein